MNGEFIVVDGGKIQAEGTNGTNGTTPQFKIENDYWFVSYDNGANWTQLGKATGEDGVGGDSMFSGVDYETSTDYVIFTYRTVRKSNYPHGQLLKPYSVFATKRIPIFQHCRRL